MSSMSPLPSRRSTSALMQDTISSLAQGAQRVVASRSKTHVHFNPTNGRQVIALAIKEQRVKQVDAASTVGGSPGRITR